MKNKTLFYSFLFSFIMEDGSIFNTQGVFIAEGIAGAPALAKKIGAKVNNNKIVVNELMKTNIDKFFNILS